MLTTLSLSPGHTQRTHDKSLSCAATLGRVWLSLAFLGALNACGGDGGGSDSPPPPPPAATLAITGTTPANNAADVPVDGKPTVTFTAAGATAVTGQATLVCNGNTIGAMLSTPPASGGTVTLTPAANLPTGAACNVSVTLTGLPAGSASTAATAIAFSTAAAPVGPKLYVGLSYMTPTPVAMPNLGVVDLSSGQMQGVMGVGWDCAGAYNVAIREVPMVCEGGFETKPDGSNTLFPKHNPSTNLVSGGARFTMEPEVGSALVHCTDDGRCFYPFGRAANASFPASTPRIGIANSDQSVKGFVAAPDSNYRPLRSQMSGGKIYLLSIDSGSIANSATVSRFDVASERFENFSAPAGDIRIAQRAFAIAIVGSRILVGVERGSDGKDIIAFDVTTGARVSSGDLTLQGGAQGFVATNAALYVPSSVGVQSFDPATGALKRAVTGFNAFALSAGNGKVYVSVLPTGAEASRILELDPDSLTTVRTFQVPNGTIATAKLWVIEPR